MEKENIIKNLKIVGLVALGIGLLIFFLSSFTVVDTGYRGIKKRFGVLVDTPLTEGLYFTNPFTTSIFKYSVKQEKWSEKTPVFTKDTQRVDVDFSIVYSPDPKFVNELYKEVGDLNILEEKIIKPIVLGSIKDSIGSVIADELIMKRELVTKDAYIKVIENLKSKHVLVSELQFTNLDFDDAYEKAVEQKVVAIQDSQKAKNDTVRIEEEAKQTVSTAKAEAESMRIKSQALSQNKGLVEFELAKKWDGKLPEIIMGNSVPMLNLDRLKK